MQPNSLWRNSSVSDTWVDKVEHFLWWLLSSLSDMWLKLITQWKGLPRIFHVSLWGINSTQVVWMQIPWIQVHHTIFHQACTLAVNFIYFQWRNTTRDNGKTCILPCFSNVHVFMKTSSPLTSAKLMKCWLQLFKDFQLSTSLIWSKIGVNISETMLE